MSVSPTVRNRLLAVAAVVLLGIVTCFVIDFVSWRKFLGPGMCGEAVAIAIVGAAVGMLAVLVPLLLTMAAGIRRQLDALRGAVRVLAARVDALAERVPRIEGAMSGPWRRPAESTPAAASSVAPCRPGRREPTRARGARVGRDCRHGVRSGRKWDTRSMRAPDIPRKDQLRIDAAPRSGFLGSRG